MYHYRGCGWQVLRTSVSVLKIKTTSDFLPVVYAKPSKGKHILSFIKLLLCDGWLKADFIPGQHPLETSWMKTALSGALLDGHYGMHWMCIMWCKASMHWPTVRYSAWNREKRKWNRNGMDRRWKVRVKMIPQVGGAFMATGKVA